jgi:hypothetical protein
MILMFVLLHLFIWIVWFSSKAEAWWPMAGEIVPASVEAPPLGRAPLYKKRWGSGASWKTSARRAPRLASVRGGGRGSVKIKTKVLLDVNAGASDELMLAISQSFKDARYSPSTGMDEREWQIMLEQFIASGVVVKNEVINIDSD